MSRSRSASACLASDAVSAATRSWSACAFATAAARWDSARLMAMSRSASAAATSASRLMRAMSGRPMLVMYSFLSRTSFRVKLTTSSPILFMSAAHVERMRSPTISGSFTMLRPLGEELLGGRSNGHGVGLHFELRHRFNRDGDALVGIEALLRSNVKRHQLQRELAALFQHRNENRAAIGYRSWTAYSVNDERFVRPDFSQKRGKPRHRKENCEYQQPGNYGHGQTKHKDLPFPLCSGLFASFVSPGNSYCRLLREVFPLLHVGNSVFVARDRHFRSIGKRLAVFAPCPDALARSLLFKNHFSRAVLADRRADRAHRPFDAVIPIQHVGVAHFHNLRHEFENHSCGKESGRNRDKQCARRDQSRMGREDVANSAEPGEKGHDRHGVEPREAAPDVRHSATGQAVAGQPAGVVPPMKRQVPFERQMDVSRTAEEREHAEREAHDETEKIKISPGHRTPRAHPVRELEFETQTLLLSFAAALAADARCLLVHRLFARPDSTLHPDDPPGRASGESPPGATPPCANLHTRRSPEGRVVAPDPP